MNSTAPAAFEPSLGAGLVRSYPETRIGAFGFSATTCTEPLWCGSADAQRACGDSWPGNAEDLCCFSQEDPILSATGRPEDMAPNAYPYVLNSPLFYRDPDGRNPLVIVMGIAIGKAIVETAAGIALIYEATEVIDFVTSEFAKGREHGSNWVLEEAKAIAQANRTDVCKVLEEWMRAAKCGRCSDLPMPLQQWCSGAPGKLIADIKQAQKFAGCRRSHFSGER